MTIVANMDVKLEKVPDGLLAVVTRQWGADDPYEPWDIIKYDTVADWQIKDLWARIDEINWTTSNVSIGSQVIDATKFDTPDGLKLFTSEFKRVAGGLQ